MSSGTSNCLFFSSVATLLNHRDSADATEMSQWHISNYPCHAGASVHASPTNKPDLQHSAELYPAGFRHVIDGNGSGMHIASGGMGTR